YFFASGYLRNVSAALSWSQSHRATILTPVSRRSLMLSAPRPPAPTTPTYTFSLAEILRGRGPRLSPGAPIVRPPASAAVPTRKERRFKAVVFIESAMVVNLSYIEDDDTPRINSTEKSQRLCE